MASALWLLLVTFLIEAVSLAQGQRYIGCFADSGDRDLPILAGSGRMSLNLCLNLCRSRNTAYFGVQFAKECWCGNGFGKYGAKPANECNKRCTGQGNAFCGSSWRNNIYATGLTPLHVPPVAHPMNPNVRDQLAAQIRSQYVSFPDGVLCNNCLITGWSKREVDVKNKVFPVSQLDSVMSAYPGRVRQKAQVLRFGANAKTMFEDFQIDIRGDNGRRKSYIGMARRVNGNVELAMIGVDLVGHLVPKFNVFEKRVCKKILWVFTKCRNHRYQERRGYQPNEVSQIDKALQSETFRLFGEVLQRVTV